MSAPRTEKGATMRYPTHDSDVAVMAPTRNLHAAIEFLAQLDPTPGATFNIEHYTDVPNGEGKPEPDPLSGRHANLTIQQVAAIIPALEDVNARGAAIYVARNQCIGHRNADNVTRIRGVHADMDDVTQSQIDALAMVLKPSIVVETSSPVRVHLYWQLAAGETLGKDEAKAVNRHIALSYGADPSAVDISRLLRLPGFRHMKYRADGRTPTVRAIYHSRTYTTDEIRSSFPFSEVIDEIAARPSSHVAISQIPGDTLEAVASAVEYSHPQLWSGEWSSARRSSGGLGYPSQSEADLALAGHIVRELLAEGVDEAAMAQAVEEIFARSMPGANSKWINRSDYRGRTIDKAVRGSRNIRPDPVKASSLLDSHGDIRNAKAFATLYRGKFIHVATRGSWMKWGNGKWLICENGEHVAAAKGACGQILRAATEVLQYDQERGKKLIQEAIMAHNQPKIMAMLRLAASEPGMAAKGGELDRNLNKLGVCNGVIDLNTGAHEPNRPELLITRYCNAGYVEDPVCPKWEIFLNQVFEGDSETIDSVQVLLGYTILGLATEEKLIICYGHGSNGKSVFSNVIQKIFGGYAITAPPSLLTERRRGDTGPRNDLAMLAGTRLVSINELQAGDRLDEQVVKMLAGREPISARFLHQEYFEFIPTFTPWLRTNHKPIIFGTDDGIWRRLVLLPFNRKFRDAEKDRFLEKRLLEERDGILMWIIKGASRYLADGLILGPRIKAEINAYRSESDLLGEFLGENTTAESSAKICQRSVYSRYRVWCDEVGVRSLSKKSFTQKMAERGFPEGKSGANRYYRGLSVRES